MGLCTVQPLTLSKLPIASSSLPSKPSLPLRQTLITPSAALLTRSIFLRNLSPRATTSEETSSGSSQIYGEERDDGIIVLDDVNGAEKKEFNETVTNEELPEDGQGLPLEFLDKLNLDTDDTGSIIFYGVSAVVALWLTSAVVGAIDSIPLFPKLLEVVGLAYTVWFSSRYLLFKKNRDELACKIEELKGQVFGSEDK